MATSKRTKSHHTGTASRFRRDSHLGVQRLKLETRYFPHGREVEELG